MHLMKKIALTAALILILTSVTIIVIASSILSNSATLPSETEPEDKTEPTNEAEPAIKTGPSNETEPTTKPEIPEEIEQWSAPTRITSKVARGLCMSADGKKIAFLDSYDLFLMNTDGTALKQLTQYDTDGLNPNTMGRPSISANGERITFKASKTVGSGPPSFYHGRYEAIFVVKSDGTGLTRIFPNPKILDYEHLPEFQHTISNPRISGDGEKITFVSDSELYVINSDGTGLTLLSDNANGVPSINADGSKVAFSATVGNYSELFLINSDGIELVKVISTPILPITNYSVPFETNFIDDVCISGDGKKIAFILDGPWFTFELYVVSSDGTGLSNLYHNVTDMISINYDGGKIVFVFRESNGSYNLSVINSDGTGETLLSSNGENYSGFSISGDGRKIAFSYGSEYGTFVSELGNGAPTPEPTPTPVQNNGWNTTQIASLPPISTISGFSMSADGGKIAFSARNIDNVDELYVINSDGTGLTMLSDNIEELTGPSISADGGKVAFISDSDLCLINSDGTGLTLLVSNVKLTEYGYYYSPSISGDGRKVAVLVENDSDVLISRDLYVVNSDGTGLTRLLDDVIDSPSISWDGSKIAFTYYAVDSDELEEIYVVNSDGTGLTKLSSEIGAVSGPVISGDGNKVAFTVKEDRWDVNSYLEIFVVNSDGTGLTQITNNSWHDSSPSINYDGSVIVFVSGSYGNSEILVVNSDGTGLTQITDNFVDDYGPRIDNDGSKIAFHEGFVNTSIFVAVN